MRRTYQAPEVTATVELDVVSLFVVRRAEAMWRQMAVVNTRRQYRERAEGVRALVERAKGDRL